MEGGVAAPADAASVFDGCGGGEAWVSKCDCDCVVLCVVFDPSSSLTAFVFAFVFVFVFFHCAESDL